MKKIFIIFFVLIGLNINAFSQIYNKKDTIIIENNFIKELKIDTIIKNVIMYSVYNYTTYCNTNRGLPVKSSSKASNMDIVAPPSILTFYIKTPISNTTLKRGQKLTGDLIIYDCIILVNNYIIQRKKEYNLINIKF